MGAPPMTPLTAKLARESANGIVMHPSFMRRPGDGDKYAKPSDAPGMYDAGKCKRQAVTIAWAAAHPDGTYWEHNAEALLYGMDPWREIQGIDQSRVGPTYYYDTGRAEKTVGPTYVVFAQTKDGKIIGADA